MARANRLTQDFTEVQDLINQIPGKAEKDTSAVEGNIAVFDSEGNPVDSGTGEAGFITDAEREKLAGIESGAEVNVQSDWSQGDSSADDYIKNRTHWIEGVEVEDAQLAWTGDTAATADFFIKDTSLHFVEIPPRQGADKSWQLDARSGNYDSVVICDFGFLSTLDVLLFKEGLGVQLVASVGNFSFSRHYDIDLDIDLSTRAVHKLDNEYLDMDITPTAASDKPVTSGGVRNAISALNGSNLEYTGNDGEYISGGDSINSSLLLLDEAVDETNGRLDNLKGSQVVYDGEDGDSVIVHGDTVDQCLKGLDDQAAYIIENYQYKIPDLDTIRAGAALGATAYQKPSTGIPKSALASAVKTSLEKADTALQPSALDGKQDTLISGENIKTINGFSILGGGNLQLPGPVQSDWNEDDDGDYAYIKNKPTDLVHYDELSPTDPISAPNYATEEEVSQLRTEVDGKEDAIYVAGTYNTWIDSRYLVTDTGRPNTSSYNSITDYIDVSKYQRIKTIINQAITYSSAACVCFYDSQKNYLNAYVGVNMGSTRGYTDVIVDLPDSTHYVRFTLNTDQKSNWYLSGVVFQKDHLNDDVIGAGIQRITPDIMITGKYRGANGQVFNNASLFYTSPIAVNYGDRIIIRNSSISTSQAIVTRVTNNGDVVSVIKYGEGTNFSQHNYDIQIDFDGYVSISDLTLFAPLFLIIKADIYSFITERVGGLVDVDSSTRLSALHDNPLAVILRECGYGCLLKTWGFIGDSYTSGETPAYDGGTLKYLDCYKWSWGQQFMRIIGSEGYNFSNGGQTAKGWIRNQGVVHDDTYYGGVGGGDWRQAQENLKQGYIISLGINDKSYFGQTYLGATYTLGDVGDDVNVSDYTQNNENTFAGCYAGIIQRLLSVQPKAKIFCLTQFQDTLEEVNDVVREIVALFPNNVFLIDLHNYAFNIVGEQYYMSNGHPSPLGYAYMAYCINTYVDYIIRTRKQKFMDVTLIGSNYSLT